MAVEVFGALEETKAGSAKCSRAMQFFQVFEAKLWRFNEVNFWVIVDERSEKFAMETCSIRVVRVLRRRKRATAYLLE